MKQFSDLTEGKLLPVMLKFAIPYLLASFMQAIYGMTDLLVVGRFGDSAGVSAVATGSQIMQTINGIIIGITMGGTVLIGQYLGAKKQKDIAQTIGTIICIFSMIAAVLTIIMLIFTGPITSLMRTPPEAVLYTKQYVFICSCGIPFIIGYNAVSGILRGMGDSKTPLRFIAIACGVNIIGNLVLVGIFHMEAAGSALATIFAQALSFILAVLYIKKNVNLYGFNRFFIKLDILKAKHILILGSPLALQDFLVNISFLIITAIINSMGLTASASVGVVEKLIAFAMLPPGAFSSAISVITAQNMGAGKPLRAKKAMWFGILCSLVFGIFICIYSQWNPTSLTSLFTKDKAVIDTAALYLRSYSIDCILVCFVFCMNAFFSGSGHTLFTMAHSLIATFFVRVPVSFLFSKLPEVTLYQIGLAAPLASVLSIIMCGIYFKSGRWNTNMIVNRKN